MIFSLNIELLAAIIGIEPYLQSSTILTDANETMREQAGTNFEYLRTVMWTQIPKLSNRYNSDQTTQTTAVQFIR